MAITQNIAGAVTQNAIAGAVVQNAIAKAETDVYFLNHCGCDLQLDAPGFEDYNCDSVVFYQNLTTQYKSRWWVWTG